MISEVSQNTRIQNMEQRIEALEATVNELQTLLQNIQNTQSSPRTGTDQRLKKMQNYQQELDHMFGVRQV